MIPKNRLFRSLNKTWDPVPSTLLTPFLASTFTPNVCQEIPQGCGNLCGRKGTPTSGHQGTMGTWMRGFESLRPENRKGTDMLTCPKDLQIKG